MRLFVRTIKITSLERFRKETVRPLRSLHPEPNPDVGKLTPYWTLLQKPNLQAIFRERPV